MSEQPVESRLARFIADDETGCFLWAGAQRTAAGTYTVTLIATNAGGSNTKTRTAYVTVNPLAPVADFIGVAL